jgi:hypothetical protein
VDTTNPYTVTVTNMMGQVLQTRQGNPGKTEIDVSNFAPGLYIVNIKTKTTTNSHKLIVK